MFILSPINYKMKIISQFFICSAITHFVIGFSIKEDLKLPLFLGRSYDILQGNPYTNKVDVGFRLPLFNFTYNNRETTEDKVYLIPDSTYSSQAVSCSLESSYSQYSGTQKYQNELDLVAEINTSAHQWFTKYIFSLSKGFEMVANYTVAQNFTVTSASAHCEMYSHGMPLATNKINFTDDFVFGAIEATKTNNWSRFYQYFGSHYVSRVILGGRYVLAHLYKQQSLSLFKSLNIDLKLATSVQFSQALNISLSEEQKKYINQTNVINNRVEKDLISVIGGEPPKTGKQADWQKAIQTNLGPISFKLNPISVLFNFVQGLNSTDATTKYNFYLSSYCVIHACPEGKPDRPDPKPLVVSFLKSSLIEQKRKPTSFTTLDNQTKVGMRVKSIYFGISSEIDSIQFQLSDGITEHFTNKVGNTAMNNQYDVPSNDEIHCIRFGLLSNNGYYEFIGMQFMTRKSVESIWYKGFGQISEYQTLCLNSTEEHFIGMYGFRNTTFSSIGLNIIHQAIKK